MPFLDWVNKNQAKEAVREVPYHLIQHESVHGDITGANADNLLIQGDNLLALKALIPFYAGRVKCIFIDPPYNTKTDFGHYDDRLEHSQWLSMMYPRLVLMRELLADDGSLWVTLDDNEAHYFRVMADEIFGRDSFIIDISWRKRDGPPNDRKVGLVHDHILVWARRKDANTKKSRAELSFNLMERTDKANAQYQAFTEPGGLDPRGAFRKIDTTANGKGGRFVESLYYGVVNPYTGEEVFPRQGTCWRHNKEEMARLQADRRLYWGVKGTAKTPMRKLFESEAKQGMSSPSIWDDLALNQHASAEIEKLFGAKAAFETPKPEKLLARIIHIASSEGDIVLDSFLGSATTVAVAHKMGRRYIGIEMGDHARTHCLPRMLKVVEGEQGGISKDVDWRGGGGFRYCVLGAPAFDEDGRISDEVKFATLAAYVWHFEIGEPGHQTFDKPLLGLHNGTAYYLLYNGILGDRRPAGGNVLTHAVLQSINDIFPHAGPKVVYGETTRLGASRLAVEGVTFKQIPYDVKIR
ncbi:site-specific DNA-methyltransferase [Herminiimonas sp. CN]|uniref:site-specific DNA-methyltransferase n=1 Tax=Herminiimonas sp. CN TaxID=1349818 RepID=UPI0004738DF9|nr:site-specific DNA-methyltransferase [Herminiimonas sp. CN]